MVEDAYIGRVPDLSKNGWICQTLCEGKFHRISNNAIV